MRAKKSLGQNFLHDESVVERIIGSLDLATTDIVIEIGPGTGALTRHLVEHAGKVIAIEFDRDLIPDLDRQFGRVVTFELINEDALLLDLSRFGDGKLKVVANLPYNIATPILQRLALQRERIATMVLMFQREVADRITAGVGSKVRGYLSVLAENAFDVEWLFDVPPTAFVPVPKVWSSVVRLAPKPIEAHESELLKLVSAGFMHRRKTLLNNLRGLLENAADVLNGVDIDPTRRAETLTLDEWKALFAVVKSRGLDEPRRST